MTIVQNVEESQEVMEIQLPTDTMAYETSKTHQQ